jgi:putative transposase
MARIVVPGYPHHVTQRGNRRQQVFFCEGDHQLYKKLLANACKSAQCEIWAYCLMPNHVHLVVVPQSEDGLRKLFAEAHRRYTRFINEREEWRGHLWQERFHSFVMDENHLIAAVRYVEQNPVVARLCERAEDWRWSSAHAHIVQRDDELVTVRPMLERVQGWREYLQQESDVDIDKLKLASRTGRPMGNDLFLSLIEEKTGIDPRVKRAGRKAMVNRYTVPD